jgi:hypothetical protein
MPRPALTPQLSSDEFRRCYWLKEELAAYCRQQHLPTGGSKWDLTQRIAQSLAGEKHLAEPAKQPTRTANMPKTFTRNTVIGPGWRCSQELRAFFEREIGPRFHFDAIMRQFIHQGSGQTLDAAIRAWQAAQSNPEVRTIGPQFEYNQHIRDYFQAHPGGSLAEAIRAWQERRQSSQGR